MTSSSPTVPSAILQTDLRGKIPSKGRGDTFGMVIPHNGEWGGAQTPALRIRAESPFFPFKNWGGWAGSLEGLSPRFGESLPEGLSLPRLPIFLMSRFPFYRHLPLELLPAYKWLVIESGFSHRATKPNFKIIPFIKNESRTNAIWYHWCMTPTNLSMNQKRNHGHREQTGGPQEVFIPISFYLRKESTG